MANSSTPDNQASTSNDSWRVTALLALIMLIALFLRGYGLTGESIWWDEFSSLIHMPAPAAYQASPDFSRWQQTVVQEPATGLLSFLRKNRELDPATMPLYYSIEYAWGALFGRGMVTMRLLSVLLGMLTIPAIFLLGRSVYGPRAGLYAALALAMSPIHRHFSQEIRMYVLFVLLATLSSYTFVQLFRVGGRKWWVAHGAANLFLFWTHPFAVFLPFVQGLFVLAAYARQPSVILKWGALQAAMVLPAAIYVSTIRFWGTDSTASWMRIPDARNFFGDLFADDALSMTTQLRSDYTSSFWHAFLPDFAVRGVEQMFPWMGWLLTILSIAAVVWVVFKSLSRPKPADEAPGKAPGDFLWSLYLAAWWLLPPLILMGMSLLFRPMIMPRYTVHCAIALYVLVGAAIVYLPRRSIQRAAVGLLVVVLGYQLTYAVPPPQRTNYLDAARTIRELGTPGDLIVIHNWLWKRVFAYSLGPVPNVVSFGRFNGEYVEQDFRSVAEQCAFYLSLPELVRAETGVDAGAWAGVLTNHYGVGPLPALEEELTKRGLEFDYHEFRGVKHFLLYHVRRGDSAPQSFMSELPDDAKQDFTELALDFWRAKQYGLAVAACDKVLAWDPRYSRAYTYKGMALKETGDLQGALRAFNRAAGIDQDDYPWTWVNIGIIQNQLGDHARAQKALEKAVSLMPEDSWAHTNLAYAFLGQGNFDFAIGTFGRAIELDPADPRPREGLEDAYKLRDQTGESKP